MLLKDSLIICRIIIQGGENIKKKIILLVLTFAIIISSFVLAENFDTVTAIIKSNITVILDGNVLKMKDANGKRVDPILIKGTTYLPIRAISEALGKKVTWNEDTQTITIGENQKANLISVIKSPSSTWGSLIKGAENLQFEEVNNVSGKYNTAIKIKSLSSFEKSFNISLNDKYQYIDCDLLFVYDYNDHRGNGDVTITINNTDNDIQIFNKVISPNKVYHCEGIDIANIQNLTIKGKVQDGTWGSVYLLNPVVY